MKKVFVLMIALITLSFASITNASDTQKYQEITAEIDGNVYEIANTSKEVFATELGGGISKIKVMSVKTEDELKITSLGEAVMDGNYYIILSEPTWFGKDDEVMEQNIFIIDLE